MNKQIIDDIKSKFKNELSNMFSGPKLPKGVIKAKTKFNRELTELNSILKGVDKHQLQYSPTGRKRVGKNLPKEHLSYYVNNQRLMQCSLAKDKKAATDKTFNNIAINTAYFIQIKPTSNGILGSKVVPVDIDDRKQFKSFKDIEKFCTAKFGKLPSFITKTKKGWHILFTLDHFIANKSSLSTVLYKYVVGQMNALFNGDLNAAGYIMRNPLQHEHKFNNTIFNLTDFISSKEIVNCVVATMLNKLSRFTIKEFNFETKSKFITKQLVDLSKVNVGGRNKALLSNLTLLGFEAHRNGLSYVEFKEIAMRENERFRIPLYNSEVENIALSVFNFTEDNYNPVYSKFTREYYLDLTKTIHSKMLIKIITNLAIAIDTGATTIDHIMEGVGFYNRLARLAEVDIKTYRKYREEVKELFILIGSFDLQKDKDMVTLFDLILCSIPAEELVSYFKSANFKDNEEDYAKFMKKAKHNIYSIELLASIAQNVVTLTRSGMKAKSSYRDKVS